MISEGGRRRPTSTKNVGTRLAKESRDSRTPASGPVKKGGKNRTLLLKCNKQLKSWCRMTYTQDVEEGPGNDAEGGERKT